MVRILSLLPLLQTGILSGLSLGRSCGCHHSLCEFICAPFLLSLKNVDSLQLSSTSGITILIPSLLHRFLTLRKIILFILCVSCSVGPWGTLVVEHYVFVDRIYWCNNKNYTRLGKWITKQIAEEIFMFRRIWAMYRPKSSKWFDIIQIWFAAHWSQEATAIRGSCEDVEEATPTKIWRGFI